MKNSISIFFFIDSVDLLGHDFRSSLCSKEILENNLSIVSTDPLSEKNAPANTPSLCNKILLTGGWNYISGSPNYLHDVWAFDPTLNSWSAISPMPLGQGGQVMALFSLRTNCGSWAVEVIVLSFLMIFGLSMGLAGRIFDHDLGMPGIQDAPWSPPRR